MSTREQNLTFAKTILDNFDNDTLQLFVNQNKNVVSDYVTAIPPLIKFHIIDKLSLKSLFYMLEACASFHNLTMDHKYEQQWNLLCKFKIDKGIVCYVQTKYVKGRFIKHKFNWTWEQILDIQHTYACRWSDMYMFLLWMSSNNSCFCKVMYVHSSGFIGNVLDDKPYFTMFNGRLYYGCFVMWLSKRDNQRVYIYTMTKELSELLEIPIGMMLSKDEITQKFIQYAEKTNCTEHVESLKKRKLSASAAYRIKIDQNSVLHKLYMSDGVFNNKKVRKDIIGTSIPVKTILSHFSHHLYNLSSINFKRIINYEL